MWLMRLFNTKGCRDYNNDDDVCGGRGEGRTQRNTRDEQTAVHLLVINTI